MAEAKAKLTNDGVIVIPADYRDALGWQEGDELTLRLEKDGVRVIAAKRAIERAQALVRRYVPRGRSLADELIAERRAEASRE